MTILTTSPLPHEARRSARIERQRHANARVLEQLAEINKLVKDHGADFSCAAAHMHLSVGMIRRRWNLNALCERSKLALHQGELSLAQAEALALADHDRQHSLLEEIADGDGDFSAYAIRSILADATTG